MKFRAVIHQSGKTATGIDIPDAVVAGLGTSKRPAVRVTIGDYTYRTTVASIGGVYKIPVSAAVREEAGVAAGDVVEVNIELDNEPREVTVPDDFAEALDREPGAKQFFGGLSYSNQRRFVLNIEDAKTPETRQRRIDKAIDKLRQGQV
jgi:hypothetical protein